jgi:hypothetical protein
MTNDTKRNLGWGILFLGGMLVVVAAVCSMTGDAAWRLPYLWIAGAGGLGLLSGYTTGLSTKDGSGIELVKFLGPGILVPLLGAAGSLLTRNQTTTEKTTYAGTLPVEKVTTVVTSFADPFMQPVAVVASFFVAFAVLASLGISAGALLRHAGVIDVKTGA